MNNVNNLFDLATYLNNYQKLNPEDDCVDIIQEACRKNGWLYTDDSKDKEYYETDLASDGRHVLYINENGEFDTRLED